MGDSARRLVHVVDDDRGDRMSLTVLLQASGHAVRGWDTGDALLTALATLEDGCILLDLRMPGRSGLEVLSEIRARGVNLPVILLTGHGDIADAVRAMKDGALDFLQKPVEPGALLDAIAAAHAHMEDTRRHARLASEARVALAALTAREMEILARLAHGEPHTEVAAALGISPRTVEVHRANLIGKLQVRNLPEALRIAFAAGLTLGGEAATSVRG